MAELRPLTAERPALPLRRAVQGRGARPCSPKAGLRGPLPLPAPPRRQRQVRVHNCQARPQPPPAGFPAPRDYRSCRGSVAGSRGRGLGAGRDGRGPGAGPHLERAGSPPPLLHQGGGSRRARFRCHGDHQPGSLRDWPELKFPDPLSLRSTRVPGRPRGWPVVTGAGRSWLAYERLGTRRETSKRALAAPGASCPGPFSGRAPRPQCGRLRERRSRPGTAVAHLEVPSFRFVPKWSTKWPDPANFEKASLPCFPEIKKEQKLLGFLWLRARRRTTAEVAVGTRGAFRLERRSSLCGVCGGRCEPVPMTHPLAGGPGFPN